LERVVLKIGEIVIDFSEDLRTIMNKLKEVEKKYGEVDPYLVAFSQEVFGSFGKYRWKHAEKKIGVMK